MNAFNETLWTLLASKLDHASRDPSVRAVVLASANDKYFSAGLDLHQTPSALTTPGSDPARRAFALKCEIQQFQHSISSLEQCCKPVICALNGVALGLAIDIASAADIRLASEDAVLAIAEIDIGLAADIGTLQRFPKKVALFLACPRGPTDVN